MFLPTETSILFGDFPGGSCCPPGAGRFGAQPPASDGYAYAGRLRIYIIYIIIIHILYIYLLGGLEHVFFHHIWDVILPIDKLIFFKMVIAPPTR